MPYHEKMRQEVVVFYPNDVPSCSYRFEHPVVLHICRLCTHSLSGIGKRLLNIGTCIRMGGALSASIGKVR
jgi:hypothetical protein